MTKEQNNGKWGGRKWGTPVFVSFPKENRKSFPSLRFKLLSDLREMPHSLFLFPFVKETDKIKWKYMPHFPVSSEIYKVQKYAHHM